MSIIIKPIDLDNKGLKNLVELFHSAFPLSKKFSIDFLQWQYLNNPRGRVIGVNAFDDGKLVSHYAVIPIAMSIYGETYQGVLSLNTATHPDYQGKGLFTKLANRTFDIARSLGYSFVVGVANGNSTYGFIKKLGFDYIGQLDMKIGMGILKHRTNCDVYRVWSEDELQWRLNNPSAKYVKSEEGIFSIRSFFVKDILTIAHNVKNINCASTPKNTIFNLYVGLGLKKPVWGYINFPNIIKRPPFNLIFRDLTHGGLPKFRKDQVLFQLIDFDVI